MSLRRPKTTTDLAEIDRTGHVLGRYRLRRQIGAGGMAIVYDAVDLTSGQRVAVKVLRSGLAADPKVRERFVREAAAAARIAHPHVVRLIASGESDGVAFIAMEHLDGESLYTTLVRERTLSFERTLDIAIPVLHALRAAHRAGVIHRDVKPENIFATRSTSGRARPKLLDFGISIVTEVARITEVGIVMGTPHYMAPEQARGETVGAAVDQYAMAVTIFEALTGSLPYGNGAAMTDPQLFMKIALGAADRIEHYLPDAPAGLGNVLARALAPQPSGRYESTTRFADALLDVALAPAVGRSRRPTARMTSGAALAAAAGSPSRTPQG
jgi:serine/threonine-protein kinase